MNTYITYGFAIILAALGASLSYHEFLGQSDWFGRSGSLIVVLGILYTIFEYYEHQYDHKILRTRSPNAYSNIKYEHKHLDEKKVKIWKKTTEEQEDDVKNEVQKTTMKHEGVLLITGTLIWGFGDLPFKLL